MEKKTIISQIEEYIFKKMSETNLPGLSISLIKDSEVFFQRGFGLRDMENGLPATSKTLYCIGSVTKSFTALTIMQLQEKGLLSIEDYVSKYIPLDLQPFEEKIKLKNLLNHTSGIPALAYAEATIRHELDPSYKWLPIGSYEDMITFMQNSQDWAHTKPGERWFYLNEGYILLGAIIEKVSGETYTDYVKNHILKPLEMDRSYFKKEEVEKDPEKAVPYIIKPSGSPIPGKYSYGRILSDGGLISNVEDMTKYIMMYLNQGRYSKGQIIKSESLQAMTESLITYPYESTNYLCEKEFTAVNGFYGYGLHIYPDFFGKKLIGHGGSVLVATAYMGFIPEENLGIMVLANGSGYPLSQLSQYLLTLMLGEDTSNLSFNYFENTYKSLSGIYETYQGTMRIKVLSKGDYLTVEFKEPYGERSVPLMPLELKENYFRFYTLTGGRRLIAEFIMNKEGTELIYERYKLRRISSL